MPFVLLLLGSVLAGRPGRPVCSGRAGPGRAGQGPGPQLGHLKALTATLPEGIDDMLVLKAEHAKQSME